MLISIENLNPNATSFHGEANQRHERLKKATMMLFMIAASTFLMLMPEVAFAAGGGLNQATTGLNKFLTNIQPIIRTVAVIAIIGAGIGYMMNMVDKSLFFKIIAGIIIIASANEIVSFFWGSNSISATP